MTANYTLKNGDNIYLNENQICTATEENEEGYTTFVMSNGSVIVAKPKS